MEMLRRLVIGSGLALAAAAHVPLADAAGPDPERMVFVTGRDSARIVAIDAGTDRVVSSLDVPDIPRFVVVAAAGTRLIAATGNPARLHFFDLPAGRLLRSLDVDFPIAAMQVSEDGETVAAAGMGGIAIADVATAGMKAALPFPSMPSALIFGKKGEVLLVGDADRPRVHFIGVGNRGARRILDLAPSSNAAGNGVVHLARTPGGSTGLVLHGQGKATFLDLKTQAMTGTLVLPGRQDQIFPTINSQYFLIPSAGTHAVSVLSTWTYLETARLPMAGDVAFLNTLLADTVLFTFDRRASDVGAYDLDRRRRLAGIALPGKPTATATGPDGLKIYVGLEDMDAVAVIDVRRMVVSRVIERIGIVPADIVSAGGLSFCH